jgi:hypothetical protein
MTGDRPKRPERGPVLNQVPKLRMFEAIPPFPHTSSYPGAQSITRHILLDEDDDDNTNNKSRADWFSSKALDTNSGDNRFESRPGLSSQLPHDLPPFFQANAGIVALTQSVHDRFLPNPFQSIIHLSSYHSTLYSLASDSILK